MGTYIYSVLCAALAVSVICVLAPDGESVSKFVSFAGALAVTLTILYPVAKQIPLTELPSWDNADSVSDGIAQDSTAAAEYMARNAVLSLSSICGIEPDKISAEVCVPDDGSSDRVHVSLTVDGVMAGNSEDIAAKLSEILGFDVTVTDRRG